MSDAGAGAAVPSAPAAATGLFAVRPGTVLERVVTSLQTVPGLCSIALCGSRARGSATPASDFDLMVFSPKGGDIDMTALDAVLQNLNAGTRPPRRAVIELEVGGRKVELFFRTIAQFEEEMERARAGQFRRQFNPLHTLGFLSTVMVSYIAYCRPLWDPEGQLRRLIASIKPYPEALQLRMVNSFLTEAKLALIHSEKVRSPEDLPYLSGLLARMFFSWGMVLFAANKRYPIIDKDIRQLVAALPSVPPHYEARTKAIFRAAAAGNLKGAVTEAARIHEQVRRIAMTAVPAARPKKQDVSHAA